MESFLTHDGDPGVSHFIIAIFFAFAFVAARSFLDRVIFRRLAIWLSSGGTTKLKLNAETRAKLAKCAESMWKFTYYSTVEFCILVTIYQEPWFRDVKEYFIGWPDQELKCGPWYYKTMWLLGRFGFHKCFVKMDITESVNYVDKILQLGNCLLILVWKQMPFEMIRLKAEYKSNIYWLKLPLKLIYMCQCGFYIYSIGALLIWETRRKDFSVMMSHHVVTVFLISYSYTTRFFRIGSVILALHDASDVFLEAAKVFKYSGKELGASAFFGMFAISWLLLRLIYFPFWIIRSSSYYICKVLSLSQTYHVALYYIFNTMLLTLLVFHIYWWFLICSMVTRQLKNRGKVGEDIRSDSEDDD